MDFLDYLKEITKITTELKNGSITPNEAIIRLEWCKLKLQVD